MVRKTIKTYLGILIGYELSHSFMFATYVLFLVDSGLNLLEVTLVNLFYMVAIFLFEIPTGAVADIFGRKFSFVLGCFINAFAFTAYFFASSFFQFVIVEIILAFGSCLISGAFDAWMIDSIHYYGFNGDLKKIFGKKQWAATTARIPGAVLGGFIGTFNLALPWLFAGFGFFIVAIASSFIMKEQYSLENNGNKKGFGAIKQIAKDSLAYGIKTKNILWLLILGFALATSVQPLNMFWTVHFEKLLNGNQWIGSIWAVMSIVTLIGIWISSHLLPGLIKKTSLQLGLSYFITAIAMILAASFGQFGLIIICFMIHEMSRGMVIPITESYLHGQIPKEKRATISSVVNMVQGGGAGVGLLIFGVIGNNFGIPISWIIAGIMLFAITPVALLLKDKTNV